VIVAGITCRDFRRMLGHSISILLNTYTPFIPTMQDEEARLMDDILTPIPVDFKLMS
jgi:hypothetical protein